MENLLCAWKEFVRGKKKKPDVQLFARDLMDNIVSLHTDLANHTYQHGGYESFYITDPKRRHIHKASVRDRLMHHAVYRILYPFFDRTFIADSYSCRVNKGTHKAINRFRSFAYKVSRNHHHACWALKCDIRRFFASIDHCVLCRILNAYIPDRDIIQLLHTIIESFHTNGQPGKGLPLGNLTSQLFVNVYMNVFDQWMKRELNASSYVRYADDFVILSRDRLWLESILSHITDFLSSRLCLTTHPDKIAIQTIASGVDFLGWVQFPDHRILRRATRRRMLRRLQAHPTNETVQSYLGLLRHGNAFRVQEAVLSRYWLCR